MELENPVNGKHSYSRSDDKDDGCCYCCDGGDDDDVKRKCDDGGPRLNTFTVECKEILFVDVNNEMTSISPMHSGSTFCHCSCSLHTLVRLPARSLKPARHA